MPKGYLVILSVFFFHTLELIFNKSWADLNNHLALLSSAPQQVLAKGSLKVIGNRGAACLTCSGIQPGNLTGCLKLFGFSSSLFASLLSPTPSLPPPSRLSSFTFSHLSSSHFCFSFASFHPLPLFFSISPPLHHVITSQQLAAACSPSLIKLSSGKHFTTLLTQTHTLPVPVTTVPAPIGRYSQTSYCSKLASD